MSEEQPKDPFKYGLDAGMQLVGIAIPIYLFLVGAVIGGAFVYELVLR